MISHTGVLGPTRTLSRAFARRAQSIDIASDAQGDAVAVWRSGSGSNAWISARTISAAGVLGPIQTLSDPAQHGNPEVASDTDGDSIVVWQRLGSIQARTISPAGVLGPTATLSAGGEHAKGPQIASAADGGAAAVWLRSDDQVIQASQGP
jgi:hypothetical protein